MKTTLVELIKRGDSAYKHQNYFTCTREEWQTLKSAVLSQPAHNSSSPKLLSAGNCEGCNCWRKNKRWGLQCTVCVRNVERIVDNYAQ